MMREYLAKVMAGKNLTREEAGAAMRLMMSGQASESQMGALLTALRIKGETSEELAGMAETMRAFAVNAVPEGSVPLLDTCGTGGDGKKTFNISTTVALVVAGAGVRVAKHGNRGVSSSSGSADVLELLGVKVALPAASVVRSINTIGIGFLYAPSFHTAMRHVAKTRRELAVRTAFNVLGPLTNPAGADRQLLGVYERPLVEKVAYTLAALGGVKRAMVVHSEDGMDELSVFAPNHTALVEEGLVTFRSIDAADYGLTDTDAAAIRADSAEESAASVLAVLRGEPGARRKIVLLNAAAALVVGGAADSMTEGVLAARQSIDSGAALAKLTELKAFSAREAGDSLAG